MGRNLDSSLRRRWANGARTLLVLAAAGLAMGLLFVLGLGSGERRLGVGLIGLALIAALAMALEEPLVTVVLPRLLR